MEEAGDLQESKRQVNQSDNSIAITGDEFEVWIEEKVEVPWKSDYGVQYQMMDVTMGEDKSHACVQQQTCCHGKHKRTTPPGLRFLVYEMGIKEKTNKDQGDDRH